jgi:hypothetical protein
MTGRPSSFTQEIADEICERLAEGESLRSICRSDGMPVQATVFRWLSIDEAFLKQYARAREAQADRLADEILDIADDSSRDTIPKVDKEGNEYGEQANSEWIARSRLRVDARKWLASKMAPKKYGDKVTQEITGGGGGALVVKIVRHGDENA